MIAEWGGWGVLLAWCFIIFGASILLTALLIFLCLLFPNLGNKTIRPLGRRAGTYIRIGGLWW